MNRVKALVQENRLIIGFIPKTFYMKQHIQSLYFLISFFESF
jgi:hypothetical protein